MPSTCARTWLARICELELSHPIRIMNVCGGHERSISFSGIRSALPPNIEIIPGPGCPVCVCPEEELFEAIRLSLEEDIVLVAFGDMLRVPVNMPKSTPRTLQQARAAGADIRAIASPKEAVDIARTTPDKQVIFFVAGFETTTAPVAAMVAEGVPDNLRLLLAARLTWPVVALLLNSGKAAFDALIAPGHVATIMGPEQWSFVIKQHRIPTAIAGFSSESLLAAIYSVLRQRVENQCFLDNCYPELVRPEGNPTAKYWLDKIMRVVPATWRGIGEIPDSGYALRQKWRHLDARHVFPDPIKPRRRAGKMPPGCDCASVLLGNIYPDQCRLYGQACTPRSPIGPCMVSDEGACHIWWMSGRRTVRRVS